MHQRNSQRKVFFFSFNQQIPEVITNSEAFDVTNNEQIYSIPEKMKKTVADNGKEEDNFTVEMDLARR